jgi:CheY-like chemotaxis protein
VAAGRSAASAARPQARRSPPYLAGLRLLVIEDHADTREMLRQMLERLGAEVWLAPDGEVALDLLRRRTPLPTAILCDLMMPVMDGLEFARLLQRHLQWASIPIIAVTALGQLADYIMTWTTGFQAHVTKPVDAEELANVIRRIAPAGP